MREADNFAFRPRRERRKLAAASRRVRTGLTFIFRLLLISVVPLVGLALAAVILSAVAVYRGMAAAAASRLQPVADRDHLPVQRRSHSRLRSALHRATARRVRSFRVRSRWVRSRRATVALGLTLSFVVFGGVIPVNAAAGDITTLAGRPDSGDGGQATSALIHLPHDAALGPNDDVYIADTYNHRIRRVSSTTGVITTIAGIGTSGFSGDGGPATSAQLRFPEGVWVDSSGDVLIADTGNNRIRRIDTSGTITTIAGTGTAGYSGDNGAATSARLNSPSDVTANSSGSTIYIADRRNHRIRRINSSGTISTYAGTGVEGYSGDGNNATSARLNDPTSVYYESGDLYIADRDNHRIRRVSSGGTIRTEAGNGNAGFSGDGSSATSARINAPEGVSIDSGDDLYIADTGNDRIREVRNVTCNNNCGAGDGDIDTVAGSSSSGFSGDGGSATSARLDTPTGVVPLSWSSFYIADSNNQRVRFVDNSNDIDTFAGKTHYQGDGGTATDGSINGPMGVAVDGAGNVFVADYDNHRIRKVDTAGTITTVAGNGVAGSSGDGGAATSARLNFPADVAVDAAGNLYIADYGNHKIRKVNAGGVISTFAGTGTEGYLGDGGAATSARLNNPLGVGLDSAGNLYIADTDNHRIRKVDTGGTITTVAGNGTGAFSGDGGPAISASIRSPADVAVDSSGSFYIADSGNHRVRSVIAGTIRTFAGTGSASYSGDGGQATSAALESPMGVAIDAVGDVFIADSMNDRVRKVDGTGVITTVAGNGSFGFSGDGGPAVSAEMAYPARVALDANGNFYIADRYNFRIRMVEELGTLPGPTMGGTTPASPANDNAPLVYGTATAGTTVKIYTDSDCVGPVAATGTDAEFASPGLAVSVPDDSTTSFYATATSGFGQVSACSMSPVVYVEDSTPPAPPTITIPPASPDSDLSPSWSFTTDAGATAECELSYGGSPLYPFAPCTSPASYDLLGQPDGDYIFTVRAVDAAGNPGNPTSDTYTLDSTSPPAPTITSTPANPGNDTTPTWGFTTEAGTTGECELSRGVTILYPFAACAGSETYDLSLEPDGDYTFRVQARDGVGNVSAPVSHTYTLDTAAPGAPTIDTAPASPSNDTTPSWSFTPEAGTTAECEFSRGGTVVSAWGACSSPKTYNLSSEPDGDYDFKVRARDAAGNTGPEATSSYTLDTAGPDTSITSSPVTPDNDLNPSWSFSTEAGATPECELSSGGTVLSPYAPCSSPQGYNLAGQPDGVYTFTVRADDAAGNTGAPGSGSYTLDTTAPDVDITSGPAPLSSEQNPTWDFSSEAGVTTECELSSGGTVLSPYAPCTSPQSYDLTTQPDGDYTFSARATDEAGNLGPASSATYTLDTSGPASSISSSPTSPGTSLSPSWGFTTEPGATTECELSSGGTVLSPYAPCTSPHTYDLTGQPDGPYTFSVRATDGAGNVGAPAGNTYTLDTTPPAAPTITSAPNSPGTTLSPTWTFTTEAGATTQCELSRAGVVLSPWSACTSPRSYNLAGEPDGTYTFRVRATDAAGNTGAAAVSTYELDTTAPTVSIVSGPPSPGNDRTPSWDFTTEAGASTECQLMRGGTVIQPFAPCASPVTYDLAGQPDGAYTLQVRATDAAGNTGPVASSGYVLDTAGPVSTIVSGPTSPGNGTTPSWTFTTEAGATTECELTRGVTVMQAFAPCTSPKSYDLAGEADGDYTFRVRATDAAGNTGPPSSATYTLDTTGPAAPVITSSPTTPGSATSLAWSFTVEAGATAECELTRGATVIQAFAPCTSPKSYDLAGEADGGYTFRVRALDALGNTSASASSTYTLDTTGPDVTITSGPASPGNDRNPTWSFTTEAGAATECELTLGGTVVSPSGPCSSPAAFNLGFQPDGTYSLRVQATDAAGNVGTASSASYQLDTVGPDVTITDGPESPGSDPTPKWKFTSDLGATFECRLTKGSSVVSGWGQCDSPKGFDLTGEPDGNYTFRVHASDGLGNTGPDVSETYELATHGGGEPSQEDGSGDEGSGGSEQPAEPPSGGEETGSVVGGPGGSANDEDNKDKPAGGETSAEEDKAGEDAPIPTAEEAREASERARAPRTVFGDIIEKVGTVAAGLIQQPAFPLSLIAVVVGFLVLQNRFDRRDPKLALAPVYADPHLYFENPQEGPGKDR